MKAVIWTAYGPPEVLELRDIATPAPRDNQILVKIRAANVTAGDCEQRALKFSPLLKLMMRSFIGFTRPKRITVLGMDLAGEIEAVGSKVTTFKPGEKVFATTGFFNIGAYAEYICLPVGAEDCAIARKPENVSWEQAAAVPTGGLEARWFLGKAALTDKTDLLVIGAGGTIGTVALQLAKLRAAVVTAVDSTDKLDLLKELGADRTVDHMKEAVTKSGGKYDVIFDIAGHSSILKILRLVKKNGTYLRANPGMLDPVITRILTAITGKTVISGGAVQRSADLEYLAGLMADGTMIPIVDRTFTLEQAVEAHKYVESGQKNGNVILKITAD